MPDTTHTSGDPGQPTHAVENQPPPLPELNLYETDWALVDAVAAEGGGWAETRLATFGALVGSARVQELGRLANRHLPELRTHDRFGHRIDQEACGGKRGALRAPADQGGLGDRVEHDRELAA